MSKSSRSRSVPRLAAGEVGGAALRLAIGRGRTHQIRPYTIRESMAAADLLADQVGVDKRLFEVGVTLDMICGTRRMSHRRLAAAVGIPVDMVAFYELVWENLDQQVRFDIIRSAVRIVQAERLKG